MPSARAVLASSGVEYWMQVKSGGVTQKQLSSSGTVTRVALRGRTAVPREQKVEPVTEKNENCKIKEGFINYQTNY